MSRGGVSDLPSSSSIAASPVAELLELERCFRCDVELTRFNRACVHVLLCLGCEDEIQSIVRG